MDDRKGKTWAEVCRDGVPNPEIVTTITYYPRKPCLPSPKLPDLPFEIITEILARLPIEALIRNKTVCKEWNNLTTDPRFIDMQAEIATSTQPRRILLFSSRWLSSPNNVHSLFLVDKKRGNWKCRELTKDVGRKKDEDAYSIVGSCNGLLCMAFMDEYGRRYHVIQICIFNPIKRETQLLPDYIDWPDDYRSTYGFGFDKISNQYKVVCFYRRHYYTTDYYEGNLTAAQLAPRCVILTLGERVWRKLDLPYKLAWYPSSMVLLDGALHTMLDYDPRDTDTEMILSLDIHTEEFSTISFPPLVQFPDESHASTNLINFAESLAIVETDRHPHGMYVIVRIWQIMGSRDTGRRLCQYNCRLPTAHCRDYFFEIKGMLSDGNFLFMASDGKDCDELIVYDTGKKKCFIVPWVSAPKNFRINFLVPSLISPSAICRTKAQIVDNLDFEC